MKSTSFVVAAGLLLSLSWAGVPDHFSDQARKLLADSVAIEPTEYPLNVVYFMGNDYQPVADYERRLSELMLYVQQFYAKEMARNGFPGRSFGLERLENGNVKLYLVRGSHPHRDYAYGSGHNRCMEDIRAWSERNPGALRSHHTLVIMPTFYDEIANDMSPGGVPFYGLGRNCFALDYAHFDLRHLGQDTPKGRLLTKWLGGLAHELGHGLNLPHNESTVTDRASLGTPLMGAGNYTFGMKPTYITLNSCRRLERCQVFAPAGDKTDFYAENAPRPEVKEATLRYTGSGLELSVRCNKTCYVAALLQAPPYSVNRDYDAVSFCATAQPGEDADGYRTHTVSIPFSEITERQNLGKGEQGLDIIFTQPCGWHYRWRVTFDCTKLAPGSEIPLPPASEMWRGY